jgi:hypothetical protein
VKVQQKTLPGFMVSIRHVPEQPHAYSVTYVPRGPQQARTPGGGVKRVPEYKALVNVQGDDISVNWQNKPSVPDVTPDEFDEDVRYRMRLLIDWLRLVSELTDSVREWAREFDWSTKVVEKPMEDSEIGNYKAPALLLQQEITKVLLEPIARQGPGTEGLVDLYLMPGYDDIASLYYYDHCWNLHYQAPSAPVVASIREGKAKPLTKASFLKTLEDMRRHAQ